MLNLQLAKKYSKAIFEIAQDEHKLEEYGKELSDVSSVVFAQPDLRGFVTNPQIQPKAKKEIFTKLFAGELSPDVFNFMMLLIDKRRIALLEAIEADYERLSNKARGIVIADVITARPMSEAQSDKLKAKLETVTGKSVRVRPHIDESILGGVIVKIGDKRIDGSVTGRMQTLKAELLANK